MDNIYVLNSERAVLSSILFDHELFDEIVSKLRPSDFYLPAHQKIFQVMIDLYKEDIPIDEDFIRRRLDQKEVSDAVLVEVLSANPIANVGAYIDDIKDGAIKRYLAILATHIKKILSEDGIKAFEAVDMTQEKLTAISNMTNTDGIRETAAIIDDYHKDFEEASKHKEVIGTRSGVRELDMFVVFKPGNLVVIAARPSMGKTALSTTITANQLKQGHGILFDSLEMPGNDLMQRLIATYTEDDLGDLARGVCKDIGKYNEAREFYKKSNLILHDKSYLTINQLKAKAIKIFRKNPNIKTWIIDHARYIKYTGNTRHLDVSDGIKVLKDVAKQFGITLIFLTQLNREIEQRGRGDHRPKLSDLRDSGAFEEDGDIIIFPHRDSYYKRTDAALPEPPSNEAELIVAKNRNGRTGVAKCMFVGPSTKFVNKGEVPISITTYKYINQGHGDNEGESSNIEMPFIN